MIIATIGISLNTGIIPPITRQKAKILSLGAAKDFGSIPPKNFFRAKISTVDVSGEVTGIKSILFYQIN